MGSPLLARGRALATCACAALAVGAAGCTTTATTPSVTGSTLLVFVSVPPGATPEMQDVISAERLAFQQAGSKAGKFTVRLVAFAGRKLSDSAREAIGATNTIAYLGELAPGASEASIGITNAQDLLQVSPTDTALEEIQSTPAVPGSPNRYYESLSTYGRTFARVVPTGALEAKALISQMQSSGVKQLYVQSDASPYGKALAHAVTGAASSGITLTSSPQTAQAALYAGTSASAGSAFFNQVAQAAPSVKLFASSAQNYGAFVSSLSPAAQRNLYVSSPGFTTADLPAAGQQFVSAFRAAYGHAPAQQAIFGYEAMSAVMAVLREAGSSAGNRSTVVHDFLAIRNRSSALGTYSINRNGDTSLGSFVIDKVKAGKLVPYKAVQEQG